MEYEKYRNNVRKEYYNLSNTEFDSGRIVFLLYYSKRKTKYLTKMYQNKFESLARENIMSELNILLSLK